LPSIPGQTITYASPVLNASRWTLPEFSGMLPRFQISQAFLDIFFLREKADDLKTRRRGLYDGPAEVLLELLQPLAVFVFEFLATRSSTCGGRRNNCKTRV
jgi:hypothetical protein